jgi:hypothetical protein
MLKSKGTGEFWTTKYDLAICRPCGRRDSLSFPHRIKAY